ncbi:AraC family transcriptional regulator [Spongiivirga sp. MCCC 1A20706]|uniref:helix-turn-helix domain-containing protein n=1 Tax=Spongiivirga sp. MCCC 1A20706 TaxID=3160963 RepID=UPI0039779BE1
MSLFDNLFLFLDMLFTFPNFNLYSTPLLILVLQGLLFSFLLFRRFFQQRYLSDLFLACILLITCYHRTSYTIGFMDWYDTFRNTKINYWLAPLQLIFAPCLYFYVRSVTNANFKLTKKHIWHFVPGIVFLIYRYGIFIYDAQQPGFADTQNGVLFEGFHFKYINPLYFIVSNFQLLLYFAFSFQLYFAHRKHIQHYFSNTYKLELNWLRNFLFVYAFLFLYGVTQDLIDSSMFNLTWTQEWWYHFISAIVIIYVGIKGYFTKTDTLSKLKFSIQEVAVPEKRNNIVSTSEVSNEIINRKKLLDIYMTDEKPYLNPDINLIELAEKVRLTRAQLSEVINVGYGNNFNDFINKYRVDAVQQMIENGKHEQLSLLGIAYECGFNSKATFNRVFKKFTQISPTEFAKTISA